jgi:hypothetical protein
MAHVDVVKIILIGRAIINGRNVRVSFELLKYKRRRSMNNLTNKNFKKRFCFFTFRCRRCP